MKLKLSFILALITALVFTGCSMSPSGSDLLHPPKTTGNEAEIEQLIESTAKGSYMLKYPNNGDYRSAIITNDFDKDGEDEAIAFYRTTDNEPVTNMLIMSDTKNGFKTCLNYETQYTDIDCVQFADYDFDGIDEILVGFVTYTSGINELVAFDYNTEKDTAKAVELTSQYSSFTTGDFDSDRSNEIMLLTLSSADTKAKATLIDYDKNQLYIQSSCNMDSNVIKFDNIQSALINTDTYGVIVDGFTSDSYNSQVIVFNEAKLQIEVCKATAERTQPMQSRDIDDDGFIEIPEISSSPMAKKADPQSAAPMITWYGSVSENNPTEFLPEIYSFGSFEYSYGFMLPDNMINNTTAVTSADNKTLSIYHLKNNRQGKLILTFKVFDTNNSPERDSSFTLLESMDGLDYCYSISDSGIISDDTVKANFTLYNKGVQ